ncbi:hypothetical protein QQ045_009223 [Rhodiola kirilowii]
MTAFSSLNIIKSTLINKMNNEFLDDLMVLYVERTFADYISNDTVLAEFELSRVGRFRKINITLRIIQLLARKVTKLRNKMKQACHRIGMPISEE